VDSEDGPHVAPGYNIDMAQKLIASGKVRVFPKSQKELSRRARLRSVSIAVIVEELLAPIS